MNNEPVKINNQAELVNVIESKSLELCKLEGKSPYITEFAIVFGDGSSLAISSGYGGVISVYYSAGGNDGNT